MIIVESPVSIQMSSDTLYFHLYYSSDEPKYLRERTFLVKQDNHCRFLWQYDFCQRKWMDLRMICRLDHLSPIQVFERLVGSGRWITCYNIIYINITLCQEDVWCNWFCILLKWLVIGDSKRHCFLFSLLYNQTADDLSSNRRIFTHIDIFRYHCMQHWWFY